MSDPSAPAVKTVPTVPVPSRFGFAVEMSTEPMAFSGRVKRGTLLGAGISHPFFLGP